MKINISPDKAKTMEDKHMRTKKIFSIVFVLLLAVSSLGVFMSPSPATGETPATSTDDGYYDIYLYLTKDHKLSTTEPTTATTPELAASGISFTAELKANLSLKPYPVASGEYGFNLSIQARSNETTVPPPEENLNVTLVYVNGSNVEVIGEGSLKVSSLKTYVIPIIFNSSDALNLNNGTSLKLHLKGDVIITAVSTNLVSSYLLIHGNQVEDISHATVNSRNERTEYFPLNDWPEKKVNITGTVKDAFGSADLDSALVVITKDNMEYMNETVTVNNSEFYAVWSYDYPPTGVYEYRVTVYDVQGHPFHVNGTFQITTYGVVLTSPSQNPEGTGVATMSVTPNGTVNYTINVRNTGNATVTVDISLSGTSEDLADCEIWGENVSVGEGGSIRVNNVPRAGYKAIYLQVRGGNRSVGDVIRVEITGSTADTSYTLAVETKITPYRGVELNTTDPEIYVLPGKTASFDIRLINKSPDADDSFTVEFDYNENAGWDVVLPPDTEYYVEAMSEVTFTVEATAPETITDPTEEFPITITATSNSNPNTTASLTVKAIATHGVYIPPVESQSVLPDETATFELTVKNELDETATFNLTITAPSTWNAPAPGINRTVITLGPLEETKVSVTMTPTIDVNAGTYSFAIKAVRTDRTDVEYNRTIHLIVEQMHAVHVTAEKTLFSARPGETITFTVVIYNDGNGEEIVDLGAAIYEANGAEKGKEWTWNITFSIDEDTEIKEVTIGAREHRTVKVTVEVPREVKLQRYIVELKLKDSTGTEVSKEKMPMLVVDVSASFSEMAAMSLREMWIQTLLFLFILVVGIATSIRLRKNKSI